MIRSLFNSTRDQLLQINWTILAIRTFNILYNALQTSIWASKKTYAAVTDAFAEEVFVFFKGDSTPYHARHVIQDGPGIASIAWTFNKNTKTFTSSNAAPHTHAKYLEWLSASIQYNGLNLYSLDDVIEGTKYVDANGVMPSNDILVAAWSLTSGIVLDKTIDLKLFIIHSDGHEEVVSLWSQYQKKVEVKKPSSTLIIGAADKEPKNQFIFPSGTTDASGVLLTGNVSAVNERIMNEHLNYTIVNELISRFKTNDVIEANSETPLTNGIPEVDFEKVD